MQKSVQAARAADRQQKSLVEGLEALLHSNSQWSHGTTL